MAAGGYLPFVLSSCPVLNTAASVVQTAGVLAFLLSSLEHRCAGSSDCGGVLEYIEPMCIEAHLEALYIPTLLGLEEYKPSFPPTDSTTILDSCLN